MSTVESGTLTPSERIDRLLSDGLGLLNVREAAAFLGPGFSARWVEDQIYGKRDPLPSFMVGGKRVIRMDDLTQWVEVQRVRSIANSATRPKRKRG